jgi:hypothetical protein
MSACYLDTCETVSRHDYTCFWAFDDHHIHHTIGRRRTDLEKVFVTVQDLEHRTGRHGHHRASDQVFGQWCDAWKMLKQHCKLVTCEPSCDLVEGYHPA